MEMAETAQTEMAETADSSQPKVDSIGEDGRFVLKLTERQLAIMREVVNARGYTELLHNEFFIRWCEMMRDRILKIEKQFMDGNISMSKDVAWVMRERLVAVKAFWDSGIKGLRVAEETLNNPREIETALKVAAIDPADFAGDLVV
jgi:hypothetical protein